jgi:hypothetical protein
MLTLPDDPDFARAMYVKEYWRQVARVSDYLRASADAVARVAPPVRDLTDPDSVPSYLSSALRVVREVQQMMARLPLDCLVETAVKVDQYPPAPVAVPTEGSADADTPR